MQHPYDIVEPFYSKALTVTADTAPAAVLEHMLASDFRSINGQEIKSRDVLMRQIEFFWKLIPDLRWQPEEVIVSGEKVVVRSVATGSPAGDFMGMSLDGGKSFRIDTIDIHTVRDGKVVEVFHLEDWATAMRQLKL